MYTVGISPLPSDKLVQNWLGVGGVKSLHVGTVGVGHTSHDFIYLVHGGSTGEEGLSCEERRRERRERTGRVVRGGRRGEENGRRRERRDGRRKEI